MALEAESREARLNSERAVLQRLSEWESTGCAYPEALRLVFLGSSASRTFMAMSFDFLSGL